MFLLVLKIHLRDNVSNSTCLIHSKNKKINSDYCILGLNFKPVMFYNLKYIKCYLYFIFVMYCNSLWKRFGIYFWALQILQFFLTLSHLYKSLERCYRAPFKSLLRVQLKRAITFFTAQCGRHIIIEECKNRAERS